MQNRNLRVILIPVTALIVFVFLNALGALSLIDNRIFDILLGLRRPTPERTELLLVDFDDQAIEAVGTWPVSREVFADGLLLMKEMETAYVVFDIEFVDKSPRGVNSEVMENEIPEKFHEEIGHLARNIGDLFEAISSGMIPLEDSKGYIQDLVSLTETTSSTLLEKVGSIVKDNDDYLGKAARFFDNTFFTIHFEHAKDDSIPGELKRHVIENMGLDKVVLAGGEPPVVEEIRPAIMPVMNGARGAGFTNAEPDEDGVRRRLDLIVRYGDTYLPQLSFSALVHWLGDPIIEYSKDHITLRGARPAGEEPRDIRIPLASDGKVLVNWSQKSYAQSYRHLSFSRLILHTGLYADLVYNLKARADWGYLDPSLYGAETPLLAIHEYARGVEAEALSTDDEAERAELVRELRAMRELFLTELARLLAAEPEKAIMAQVETVLSSEDLPDNLRLTYETIRDDVTEYFTRTRSLASDLTALRAELSTELNGAFAVIGHTGTGTTDIGVTPFEKGYMNVGTHAAIANTIINGSFLDDVPDWIPLALAGVLSFLLIVLIRGMKPLVSILTGLSVFIGITVLLAAFFIVTGVYVPLFTPSAMSFGCFLAFTVFNFLKTENEKGFLKKAFSHYLSSDVINTLIAHPEKLNLGGEMRRMTALFTDIRGFSTISEQLDPESLVRLLNLYLTEMSDLILDLQGTIDKYEGDAIIAFFNAPIDLVDHASLACLAAVRMKRAERLLNEQFLRSSLCPTDVFTRIGINTGDMVVGNMGTLKKMDYTIIGNSVNLAARLEGVNKVYGTSAMVSEDTFKEGCENFITRKLDRIRVVGIHQPVRIYELLEEKGRLEAQMMEMLACFAEGLDLFELREWQRSFDRFQECLKIVPTDGPSQYYMKACRNFMQEEPVASWDGVFNLDKK